MSVVVVAGAGTGKTHALVERYLHALLGIDGADPRSPDSLLAITFTEKAAHEMRARVQRRLGSLRFDDAAEPELRARIGRVLDAKLVEGLRRSISGAPIFTFHAFCARLLRDHALAAGLDPAFTVLEPDDERRLLEENAEACVIDALQRQGIAHPEIAELVARVQLHGFGERKGLVECLVDLHGSLAERGLDASALTLTAPSSTVEDAVSAVDAAVLRVKPLASGLAVQRLTSIDHAMRALVDIWRTKEGDVEAAVSHAFRVVRDHASGGWGGAKITEERRAVAGAVDALGAALIDELTKALAPAVRALVVDLDERQRREKLARGFLAFGDLLLKARDLLRSSPNVRARVRERFTRVFVDEYQDTSPVQEEILHLLCDADSEALFVVGDPKQSIYGFRGADSRVFSRALVEGKREELSVSRRSLAPIVKVANLVAQHALPRGDFGVDRAQLVDLSALREGDGDGAAGEHWVVAKEADAPRGQLTPHELESIVVARRLRELIDAERFRAGDVAILVRRGKAAVPLARALARVRIPSIVVGGDGFFVRPEVSDVIAALTLAADPIDEIAVWTVLRSPLVGLPDDDIVGLYEKLPEKRGLTWPAVVAHASNERVRAFDAVLTTVRQRLHHEPLGRAVDALLDDGHYAAAVAVEHDASLRLANLEKLRGLVSRGERAGAQESALVSVARLAAALDDPPPEPLAQPAVDSAGDAVRIMTIHQAKGLEFPVVVVADAGSGLRGETDDVAFDAELGLAVTARGRPIAACAQRAKGAKAAAPTAIQRVRRRLRERSENELARLLYVAVTRARDRLYVVGEPRRAGWGSLLGALGAVRAADASFDALLPRVEVHATLPDVVTHAPSAATPAPPVQLLPRPPPPPSSRLRVRASEIVVRGERQLGLPLGAANAPVVVAAAAGGVWGAGGDLEEHDRMPPRAAGRLAHAVISLVATEARDALADRTRLPQLVVDAARACGVVDAPPHLLARCVDTLHGPVRALADAGAALSFEETLRLDAGRVVVEGRADVVARTPKRAVVVELRLSDKHARTDTSLLQLAAYAAALQQSGERDVAVSTWILGETEPPAPSTFGARLKAKLDAALLALS